MCKDYLCQFLLGTVQQLLLQCFLFQRFTKKHTVSTIFQQKVGRGFFSFCWKAYIFRGFHLLTFSLNRRPTFLTRLIYLFLLICQFPLAIVYYPLFPTHIIIFFL